MGSQISVVIIYAHKIFNYLIQDFLKIPRVRQCDELVLDILLSEVKSSSMTFVVTTEPQ